MTSTASYRVEDLPERIAMRVELRDQGGAGPCWVWIGSVGPRGYGHITRSGVKVRAHRLVYQLLVGDPAGFVVDHLCHHPDACPGGDGCPHRRCVNPAHHELKSSAANVERGRRSPGKSRARELTACSDGHEFTEENTLVLPNGHRRCRICQRRWDREYQARKRAAAA